MTIIKVAEVSNEHGRIRAEYMLRYATSNCKLTLAMKYRQAFDALKIPKVKNCFDCNTGSLSNYCVKILETT